MDIEARKTGVKDKYFSAFLAVMKEHQDDHKEKKLPTGPEFLQRLHAQMPEHLFNPALFIPDLDANQDTPVEILHVILLGVVKYFWCDAVACQTTEGKETLKAHINSLDVSALGLSPLRGATLVQYAGSLTGAWLELSRLGPLAFQQEINEIDEYSAHLTLAINSLLDATVHWTPQWFNKPKFHILLHLPQHVQHFGSATLFATETFESYNFVIRLQSVHSNRHAPSHDISRAFSRLQAVCHLVSGGWVTPPPSESTGQPQSIPCQAGQAILNLRDDPEFMSLMGMSSVISTESLYGSYRHQQPSVDKPWGSTKGFQCSASLLSQSTLVTLCSQVVLKNHDVARLGGFVAVTHQNSTLPAHIIEIISAQKRALGLTVKISHLLPNVDPYGMPGIKILENMVYIPLDNVLCSLSIFHNCALHGCTVAQTRAIRQERQETTHLGKEVQHTGDQFNLVLNVASLRSSTLIQTMSPLTHFACTPESIAETAQRAVTVWRANEAKTKEEKKQKEEDKSRKAEEREQKKLARAARKAELEIAEGSGPSSSGKRKR